MNEEIKQRVIEKLKHIDSQNDFHVVLLPDFFVDHFISFDSFQNMIYQIDNIQKQGGGNIPGVHQTMLQGGNAANTALALARLGIHAHLICRTDAFGAHLLSYYLGRHGVDLSRIKTDGTLALTTALEFKQNQTNIMLGDPGSVADFSFDLLDAKDLDLISQSDIVCVLNWNLNLCGTSLASQVFSFAKKHGVKTFFDCGDPSPRKNDIAELTTQVVNNNNLDIFGLNENEFSYLSNMHSKKQEDIVSAARTLKKSMSARLDIHTAEFSCSLNNVCTIVPSVTLSKIYRFTGAGDTWNAGDIFAELYNFTPEERLFFANCYAGYYISSPQAHHAALKEIIDFLGEI